MRSVMTSPRALATATGIAAALVLGACAENDTVNFAAQPTGPVGVPQYRPQPPEAQFTVAFVAGTPELAPGQAAMMRSRLAALALAPGDEVVITYGITGNAALDRSRAAVLRDAAGLTPGRVRIFAGEAELGADLMRNSAVVEVQRYGRLTVVCPGTALNTWQLDNDARLPAGLGCTNAINRATQASVPRDLLQPRRLSGSDGVTSADAIKRYREDEVKFIPLDSNMTGN